MSVDSFLPQKKRLSAHVLGSLVLFVAGLIVITALVTIKPLSSLNLRLSDQLFLKEAPSENIVVIGIDDPALEAFGAWADWDRAIHIRAIENLTDAHPLVVGFDILFTDSTPFDEALAESMKTAGNVVIPVVGVGSRPDYGIIPSFDTLLKPVTLLQSEVASMGHANIAPDTDGVVRQIPLYIGDTAGNTYPAFGLRILQTAFASSVPSEARQENGSVLLFSTEVPVDPAYRYRINFSADTYQRPYFSYADLINGNIDPSYLENKIILIGMTATGEYDKWMIPGENEKIPGVMIHAALIDNMLNHDFLAAANSLTTLLIMALLLGIGCILLPQISIRLGAIITVLLMAGYLAISFLCFENGTLLNILYPLFIPPFCFVGNIIVRNYLTLRENAGLKNDLLTGYSATIRSLAASIDAKDHYTRGHSGRVTEYTLMIAGALNIPFDEMETLEYAGVLHDIGKIGIPDSILTKPGKLNITEWETICGHPGIGFNIIKDVPFLAKAAPLVLHHHEKYDGSGYPSGLAGTAIPFGSRMIAVADAFDSMTSDRSYRAARSDEEAIEELLRCRGTHFDPELVDAFVSVYRIGSRQISEA